MDEQQFQEMISRAKAGEEAAADYLFVACYEPLRAAIMGFMDRVLRLARLEPEDILQEAYAAAWANIQKAEFENFAAFLGWLRAIARNKIIDLRRNLLAEKKNVRRNIDQPAEGSSYFNLLDHIAAPVSSPSRGVARNEALALLSGQMWRLPEDYRKVIQWRFVQGFSVAEVAQRLGRSEPAVHMLCHRALLKLRELLGSPSKYLTRL